MHKHRRRVLHGAIVTTGLALALVAAGMPAVAAPNAAAPRTVAAEGAAVTADQAIARARATGRKVDVVGSTTETDTLTANPDGTLTLTRSLKPTRKYTSAGWRPLDATLRRAADGSVVPTLAAGPIKLSGGGSGPLATLGELGRSVALSLPANLPTPTLDGATATYAAVLPGVDLKVTVDDQGGFSEVLVVHDAKAAANPALRTLRLATTTDGVSLSGDAAGNIVGHDRRGAVVLSAPAPIMWDSTPSGRRVTADGRGVLRDAETGRVAMSSARGPGLAARRAGIGVQVKRDAITLSPQQSMLTDAATVYPVYIDPSFAWGATESASKTGWATVSRGYQGNDYSNSNYWMNGPDPDDNYQVGNSGWTQPGQIWSRTLINLNINTTLLSGAIINTATLDMSLIRSANCTDHWVALYAPAATLTQSNATWNAWESNRTAGGWGGYIDHRNAAAGYTGCASAEPVGFNIKNTVVANIAAHKNTQTFLLAAENESDTLAYKEFDENVTYVTINYNHAPNTPTGMTTSPATSCSAGTPDAVGDGQVTLYAPVSDPNNNILGVTFQLWKTSDPATILKSSDPNLLSAGSGTTAVFNVDEPTLKTASGSAITQFSWKVQATDGNLASPWSATCSFMFDPTRAGAPTVTPPASATIGQNAVFTVTKPPTGSVPSSYTYQLNGGVPVSAPAVSGNASITVVPRRTTNTLTVISVSPGGNFGETASIVFNAVPGPAAAADDLTGDGIADLVTVGAAHNLPPGLWQAAGTGTAASLKVAATNIGVRGNGIYGTDGPEDFTGAQAITGKFTGTNLQDVLVYYPDGFNAGGGSVISGPGDGSILQAPQSGNQATISAGLLTDMNGNNPAQLANAGDASGQHLAYPDLIAVTAGGGSSYLAYYVNQNGLNNYSTPSPLANLTPAGDTAWSTWTIATTQVASGTAMFLWQPSTGALHLWTQLNYNINAGTLSYTGYTLRSGGWNTGAALGLRAADINRDGVADLWTVANGQSVTAHLVTGLTGTPTVTAQQPQVLPCEAHAWSLDDVQSGPIGTAAEAAGTNVLTATGNAVWNAGDLFPSDVLLNALPGGTSVDPAGTGSLTSATPLIDTTKSFGVSIWVKPLVEGGVILSEDGAHASRFTVSIDPTTKTWRFGMATSDLNGASYDVAASSQTVQLGAWTRLQAVYSAPTNSMALYVNGALGGTAVHTAAVSWPATGRLVLGRSLVNSASGNYYAGEIGNLQVWDVVPAIDQIGPVSTQPNLDFNADGKHDIASIDANWDLSMWPGDGAGHLVNGNYMSYTGGKFLNYHGIAVGDFNLDKRADVAAIDAANNLVFYPGNGAGRVGVGTPMKGTGGSFAGFHGLSGGDFNGDGRFDIAAIDSANNMQLYLGDGTGLVGNPSPMLCTTGCWVNFHGFVAGDYNGDGKTDIAGIDAYNNMNFYPGDGAGHVTLAGSGAMLCTTGCWQNFKAIAPGDFNSDGKTDIAGIDANNNMMMYPGAGGGLLIGGNPAGMYCTNGCWVNFRAIA
ncbi:FG-GAP-like repeat-containing protein [Catellatospora tritici]|uniref:FG-GAP-like repeat-containing protein n=1 Tax=Catellatospora tritici TaxID=2851566 RepID=UPI001C2D299A|nr:FG-GAP-like repeat-containing protein [Catellatospora tritici]MBV1848886.1 VCBS repeat-containing protein [Catellatospora tritici]